MLVCCECCTCAWGVRGVCAWEQGERRRHVLLASKTSHKPLRLRPRSVTGGQSWLSLKMPNSWRLCVTAPWMGTLLVLTSRWYGAAFSCPVHLVACCLAPHTLHQLWLQQYTTPTVSVSSNLFRFLLAQVMWTADDREGGPCVLEQSLAMTSQPCLMMNRTMALTLSTDGRALHASVVPDPSVTQYLFIVKVPVVCVCMLYESAHCVCAFRVQVCLPPACFFFELERR